MLTIKVNRIDGRLVGQDHCDRWNLETLLDMGIDVNTLTLPNARRKVKAEGLRLSVSRK